jgi:glycine/D-amino acid oxidase-like deaminating enzyme
MTTSHWIRNHQFKNPDITADIVIVGGGYVGLSTAYWLSELKPDLKIVVLDRSALGSGASGRNAGFLTKGSATFYKSLFEKWGPEKAQRLYQFGEESVQLVHQKILKSSPEIKFDKTTSLTLFQTEDLKKKWQLNPFSPEKFGFQWKSLEELPSSLKNSFHGAFENENEFRVNPMQILSSLRMSLEARKVQIIEHLSGFELRPEGVLTEYNTIKARQVILALNGYLPEFHHQFKNWVRPCRAQMLAVELEDDIDSNSLHYDSPERVYWRKSTEKILLIGGKRVLDEKGEEGNFEKISPIIQAGLESYIREQLKVRFKVLHRWSGIMGFTEHELPILTKFEGPLEAFAVGGFSGHGMGFGFKSGLEMAELVTGLKSRSFFDDFKDVKISL